jgi:leader peptidase (prepilin peptidase)/N-methyltransferase
MLLSELPTWFTRTYVVLFGLFWGSFLNVVIYRLPRGMNVAHPPSHCPGCGKPIAPYDNIPVLTYVILRGRTRCCNTPMSPRYPVVELIGGMLSLAVYEVLVRGALPADVGLVRAGLLYLAYFLTALGLVAAAFIDAEHMFLPDSLTLGGAAIGLATVTLRGVGWVPSLIGAVFGFVAVWGIIGLYAKLRGKTAMGLGDAKLLALAGAWYGVEGALFTLCMGALQGTVGAVVLFAVRGRIEEPEAVRREREELEKAAAEGDAEAKQLLEEDPIAEAPGEGFFAARIPFGPFLILAFLEYMFAGDLIVSKYFEGMDHLVSWLMTQFR